MLERLLCRNDKGIAQVINDLSNPLGFHFKSLASANSATPAQQRPEGDNHTRDVGGQDCSGQDCSGKVSNGLGSNEPQTVRLAQITRGGI